MVPMNISVYLYINIVTEDKDMQAQRKIRTKKMIRMTEKNRN